MHHSIASVIIITTTDTQSYHVTTVLFFGSLCTNVSETGLDMHVFVLYQSDRLILCKIWLHIILLCCTVTCIYVVIGYIVQY